ncbi:FIG146085: 3'-to-5' oligoribonuclease A, Bacillus type [hydrothermal vent metagenome]|uniref:FIG146085: 3'-to-5' oligoribonuclease A, Bacillus type n=1 Tax=hydrothermal vent metagenome TaxID=652676 RepID=A0A1W1CMR0_9ZZZZ
MINLTKIDSFSHIVLVCDDDSFANASAIYSYILTKHKKVSIVCESGISKKYAFLPWFEKLRKNLPSSADCSIVVDDDVLALFDFFQENGVKINKKMATALYGALLQRYDYFRSMECSGIVFATASQLIELKAEFQECMQYLQYNKPLAYFRLESILYKNMLLKQNATLAVVPLCEEDLKESGASVDDAYLIMQDILQMAHVQEVQLVQKNKKSKILKSIARR